MNLFKTLFRRGHRGTSCEQVNRFLVDYLEGVLSDETSASFQEHMSNCPACLAYFEQYETTIKVIREEHEETKLPVPDELVEHTLDFLRRHSDYGQ